MCNITYGALIYHECVQSTSKQVIDQNHDIDHVLPLQPIAQPCVAARCAVIDGSIALRIEASRRAAVRARACVRVLL